MQNDPGENGALKQSGKKTTLVKQENNNKKAFFFLFRHCFLSLYGQIPLYEGPSKSSKPLHERLSMKEAV